MNDTFDCCEQLRADHRRTEDDLLKLRALLFERAAWDEARHLLSAVVQELRIHLACEERGLFPVLSQYRPMILMEVEHEDLLEKAEALRQALESADEREARRAFEALEERLLAHIREEDEGVFRFANRVMEPEERALAARKMRELSERLNHDPAEIDALPHRAIPQARPAGFRLFAPLARPIAFETLFEFEHASLQWMGLKAGESLSPHWAAQAQWLAVLEGQAELASDSERWRLKPGDALLLDPRFYFSLQALEDTRLLALKVWPRPHFVRQ